MSGGLRQRVGVSVCMASYNGERFVLDQVHSILNQLGPLDELVVVDDASRDNTVKLLHGIGDPRVRLTRNARNCGHVRTFERSMTLARGSRILLADQDDIWLPGRVELFKKLLPLSCAVVAATALEIFDDSVGFTSNSPRETLSLRQSVGVRDLANMMAGRQPYFGCAMGMSRSAARIVLPFPPYVEAHDHWIAVVGVALGGVSHSETPSVARRLHTGNLTPVERRRLIERLSSRVIMIRMFLEARRRARSRSRGQCA